MQYYFIASFEIDDAPPVHRDTTPRDTDNLADDWTRRQQAINRAASQNRSTDIYPVARVPRADQPARVRARIITVLTRNDITPAITWHDDGSYTITPAPLHTAELIAESPQRPR